jgi:hypothetical protein
MKKINDRKQLEIVFGQVCRPLLVWWTHFRCSLLKRKTENREKKTEKSLQDTLSKTRILEKKLNVSEFKRRK